MKTRTIVQRPAMREPRCPVVKSARPLRRHVGMANTATVTKVRSRHKGAACHGTPCRKALSLLLTDQRGLNTVELVVIIAVVIGLALLFRTRITVFVTTLLDGLFSEKTAAELVRGVSVP